jgi:hypothetical protein
VKDGRPGAYPCCAATGAASEQSANRAATEVPRASMSTPRNGQQSPIGRYPIDGIDQGDFAG